MALRFHASPLFLVGFFSPIQGVTNSSFKFQPPWLTQLSLQAEPDDEPMQAPTRPSIGVDRLNDIRPVNLP